MATFILGLIIGGLIGIFFIALVVGGKLEEREMEDKYNNNTLINLHNIVTNQCEVIDDLELSMEKASDLLADIELMNYEKLASSKLFVIKNKELNKIIKAINILRGNDEN